jgi:predicted CopG family antitoxin
MENTIINMVKTIKISDEIHARLSKHGYIGETYEDVIEKLLDFYDSKGRLQPQA